MTTMVMSLAQLFCNSTSLSLDLANSLDKVKVITLRFGLDENESKRNSYLSERPFKTGKITLIHEWEQEIKIVYLK